MTKKEAVENHRKMWNWLGKESIKQQRIVKKEEYFRHFKMRPLNNNFCCQYMCDNGFTTCQNCPINWKLDNVDYCIASVFIDCANSNLFIEYALKCFVIANLPENNP